ncbi:SDR family NAD(P)-dependent oxidoreductase [Nocardioides sp. Bht2]|uniref:SDR family NAD(P)-dependent oxidoreductase n=1 Tax=Nocardioides sp. Bht2 TaxID=3392297 RepID=UPI0039B54981
MTSTDTKRVLITGAGSGLGAALADAYQSRGARVFATDRDPAGVGSRTHHLALDITSPDDWSAARDWVERNWGGVDLLVNNAGIAGGGRLDVAGVDEWRTLFEINLFGMVAGLTEFVPLFKRQQSGRIVNVASLAGFVHPGGMGAYNAVKAAVVALSETTGHELAEYGVGCSVVAPSYFQTNLMNDVAGADSALTEVMRSLVEGSRLTAADIAAAVVEGVERGEEIIVPDDAARAAIALKADDRAGYNAVMRRQAAKLNRQ